MLPALPIVKLGVSVLAGIPVSKIANDIIKNNVTVVTKIDHIKVASGSVVLGAMVAQSVQRFTDGLVDELATAVASIRKSSKDAEETPEVTEE